MMTVTTTRPRRPPPPVITDGGDLVGRLADFTIGTAVVLWHAVLASREQRRRLDRGWSSTR